MGLHCLSVGTSLLFTLHCPHLMEWSCPKVKRLMSLPCAQEGMEAAFKCHINEHYHDHLWEIVQILLTFLIGKREPYLSHKISVVV